jgi:sialic acid synthase SpsE/mannose-6-phosphate isomerase-like protein (cupin superfamily)
MIESKFDFNNLFVLDLANNHQGDIVHGSMIIDHCAKVIKKNKIRAGIKFQFRDIPAFIHKDDQKNTDNKHVPRFISTKLEWNDYKVLQKLAKQHGLLTICTPFDEKSVERIVDMDFDIIKIASCSAHDWPLLEKVSKTLKPIIFSTGGLKISEIDEVVSFLDHKGCDFAIMHCVSIYPTPDVKCNLKNISDFIERYPNKTIGWSTHEPPKDDMHVGLARALGAKMFERHVGMNADNIKLNAYSSTPEEVDKWMLAYNRAGDILGNKDREAPSEIEEKSIQELQRGVFAIKDIKAGTKITKDMIYFAFPIRVGQLSSGRWNEEILVNKDIKKDDAISKDIITIPIKTSDYIIKKAIHQVKAMLSYARIPLSHEFSTEYSHHYGVDNFFEVGVIMITIINRAYAKKVLIQLPNQTHPSHYHKKKEETFLVQWGELVSVLDGKEKLLKPGDTLTVPPGVWHSFSTVKGCIFEEISTTAFPNDSVYRDDRINEMTSANRKTSVDHWGRFQIKEQIISMDI